MINSSKKRKEGARRYHIMKVPNHIIRIMKMDIGGTWRPRPKGASTVIPGPDGVFGLGGFLMIGQEGGPRALMTIPKQDPPLPPALSWDLCYKHATKKD